MHEVDMTRCLVLAMNEWQQQQAPRRPRVDTIHLQVGAFTCVEPEQLVRTWAVAVTGSWLEGAELVIEPVPLVGRCVRCSATYAPVPEMAYRSPCCDHPMEEIVSGRELKIRSVQFSLPETAVPPFPAWGEGPAPAPPTASAATAASADAFPSPGPFPPAAA